MEKAGGDFSQVHEFVSGANQEVAWSTGDIDAGMVTTGQSGGLVKDVPTCRELIDTIVADAEAIVSERLSAIVAG